MSAKREAALLNGVETNGDLTLDKKESSSATPTPLSVSVIVPAFGNGSHLKRCLETLGSKENSDLRVLLVDDGSPDPIVDHLSFPTVQCLRLEKNSGPSHAVNTGLEHTTSEWVVVINSDVQVPPRSLHRLIQALEEQPHYAFAVAKLVHPTEPTVVDSLGDALLIGGGGYRLGHQELNQEADSSPRAAIAAAGTAAAYRRSLLEELGGFDEDFYGFLEDLDVSLRARLMGHNCLYVPSAIVYHQGGATFKVRGDGEIYRLITRNQVWLVVKNYPLSVLARALPRILVFQLLWLGLMVSRGMLGAYLRGVWGALRGLPRMLAKRRRIQRERKLPAGKFWELLRESEREIAAWQLRVNPEERSRLLRIYFTVFGWPKAAEAT